MYFIMKKNFFRILFLLFLFQIIATPTKSDDKQDVICDDPYIDSSYKVKIGDIKWIPLTSKTKLKPYNAILTCKNSYVILASNYPFNPSTIRWKEKDLHFIGKLEENILLILKEIKTFSDYPLGLNVLVKKVSGDVYYSDKSDIIKKCRTDSIKFHPSFKTDELIKTNRAIEKELSEFSWTPAEVGMTLGEWNIIWVQKYSTVEMELTVGKISEVDAPPPPNVHIIGNTMIISGNMYWVMVPKKILPLRFKIKKIDGKAFVLRDKDKVMKFHQKYNFISFSTGTL